MVVNINSIFVVCKLVYKSGITERVGKLIYITDKIINSKL